MSVNGDSRHCTAGVTLLTVIYGCYSGEVMTRTQEDFPESRSANLSQGKVYIRLPVVCLANSLKLFDEVAE